MSDYYPDRDDNTINDRLDVLVKMLDAASALSNAIHFPMLEADTHGYTLGKKYARVWRINWVRAGYCAECQVQVNAERAAGQYASFMCMHDKPVVEHQRFVDFFVQMDNGDVWKADGWKKPALNFVRGNVWTKDGRQAFIMGKINDNGHFYAGI